MDRNITFKGNPLTLAGSEVQVGQTAPDFTVTGEGLKPVKLSDFKGQTVIISTVPSLDTPVCEIQTKKFNQEASGLKAKVLTISMDLPFAQKRFCETHKIGNVTIASDYKDREFANKWGLYIKELGLIARGVFIVNPEGKLTYAQLVKEVTQEPDYNAALSQLKSGAVPAGR